MWTTHYSNSTGGSVTREAKKLVVAVALLGSVFALLVAASYPGVVAAGVTGTVSAVVVRRTRRRIATAGRICVPGTDVCLWATS